MRGCELSSAFQMQAAAKFRSDERACQIGRDPTESQANQTEDKAAFHSQRTFGEAVLLLSTKESDE